MRGAAINRERSQEGGRGWPNGDSRVKARGGGAGEGPGTPRSSDSWVNRRGGGVNAAGVEWGLGEDTVSRAGTQETLWLRH